VLHAIQHAIHLAPVVDIVWVCTGLGTILALVFALPRAFRRIRKDGDRAPRRVIACLALIIAGGAILAWFDSGGRLPRAHAASAESAHGEFSQTLSATSVPVSTFSYHSLNLVLSSDRMVLGIVPMLIKPASWIDSRDRRGFRAPVTGVPGSMSTVLFASRTVSPELRGMISRWQRRIQDLPAGHVYVDRVTARRFGIRKGDTLDLPSSSPIGGTRPSVTYWTVQAIVSRDVLIGAPSVIMPLADAQAQVLHDAALTTLVVFVSSNGPSVASAVRNQITQAAASLPPHSFSRFRLVSYSVVRTTASPDWTRRIAVGALGLVLLGTAGLRIFGRRAKWADSSPGNLGRPS